MKQIAAGAQEEETDKLTVWPPALIFQCLVQCRTEEEDKYRVDHFFERSRLRKGYKLRVYWV